MHLSGTTIQRPVQPQQANAGEDDDGQLQQLADDEFALWGQRMEGGEGGVDKDDEEGCMQAS